VVSWEQRLLALFDDLEQQAEGLALAERDGRVADLSRAGYGELDLLSRLHGAVGCPVLVRVTGLGQLRGTVVRVGADWLLADDGRHEWLVRLAAVEGVGGLPDRAVDPAARPVTARLGLGSVLRSVAEDAAPVVVHRVGGATRRARVRRVGRDFVELGPDEPAPAGPVADQLEVVPFAAVAAVRKD
jgi:hypothetical protein